MKKFLLFTLVFCTSLAASAQQKLLFENTKAESFICSYQSLASTVGAGTGSQQTLNDLLGKLAGAVGKAAGGSEYKISLEEVLRITQGSNDQYQGQLQFKNISSSGLTTFKGFDMTDVLLPAKADLVVDVMKNGQLLKSFPYTGLNVKELISKPLNFSFTDSTPGANFTAGVRDLKFRYDNSNQQAFNFKLEQIENYFKYIPQLKEILENLKKIDPSDPDRLDVNYNTVQSAKGVLGNIKAGGFIENLNLGSFDPGGFLVILKELEPLLGKLEEQIAQGKENKYLLYYQKGIKLLGENKEAEAVTNFQRSLDLRSYFTPALFELGVIDMKHGRLDDAAHKMITAARDNSVSNTMQMEAKRNLRAIYEKYLETANARVKAQKFTDAKALAEKARQLCSASYGFSCGESLQLAVNRADSGLYRSYVNDAKQQVKLRNYFNADELLDKAVAVANGNPAAVPDMTAAKSLQADVKNWLYKSFISLSRNHTKVKQYEAALENLRKARAIEAAYPVKKDKSLPGLLQAAGKPVLQTEINRAAQLTEKPAEARTVLERIDKLAEEFYLKDDKALAKQIAALREKVEDKECALQLNAFREQMRSAENFASKGDYIQAVAYYEMAIAQKNTRTSCGLNTTEAETRRDLLKPVAQYQKLRNEGEGLERNGHFAEAMQKYLQAEQVASAKAVDSIYPARLPLFDFLKTHPNDRFMLYAADHYMNSNEADRSVTLVKEVLNRGIKRKKTKDLQKRLGAALASRDIKATRFADPKKKAEDYVHGDRRLKYLRKSYVKQWKRLK